MLPRILLSRGLRRPPRRAPAAADTTTLLEPPARSPVTIPGSGLKRGERLAAASILVRRLTEVRAGDTRIVTLRCPSGTTPRRRSASSSPPTRSASPSSAAAATSGRRSARIRVFAASRETPRGTLVRSSIFALCEPS